jgi:hypothetical protein
MERLFLFSFFENVFFFIFVHQRPCQMKPNVNLTNNHDRNEADK